MVYQIQQPHWSVEFVGMITSVGSPLRWRSPQRETVKIVETKTQTYRYHEGAEAFFPRGVSFGLFMN